MSKRFSFVAAFVFVASLALAGAGCSSSTDTSVSLPKDKPYETDNGEDKDKDSVSAKGRAVFSITDAAANFENVSEVMLTVDKVEVQSATKGWVLVSNTPKKYNLLDLKASGALAFLAGKYPVSPTHFLSYPQVNK